MQLLNDEPDKAYYGLEVVEKANQSQAIECKIIEKMIRKKILLFF
jgi:stalled ribosome rescue protein Dom34